MIKFTVDSDATQKIQNKVSYLGSKQSSMDSKISNFAMMLAGMITANIESKIGHKFVHFDVKISPHGNGIKITVSSKDHVGNLIYYGTKAHFINSNSDAMPLSDGNFARSVHHPGTHPFKPEIDSAVAQAVSEIRNMARLIR